MARKISFVRLDIAEFMARISDIRTDSKENPDISVSRWIWDMARCLSYGDPSIHEYGAKLLNEADKYRKAETERKNGDTKDIKRNPKGDKGIKRSPPLSTVHLKEYISSFEVFRKAYPGKKRSLNPEFENFQKKFGERIGAITPLLLPAAKAYAERCRAEGTELKFRKHLRTWINNECWTEEAPADLPKPPPPPDDGYRPDSLWDPDA